MTQRGGIAYLDGDRLALAMGAGVARLLSRQNHLNRINVLPVADMAFAVRSGRVVAWMPAAYSGAGNAGWSALPVSLPGGCGGGAAIAC